MIRRGFTTIEIVITVTIMAILLVLAFVNLSASQVRARDEERVADVESFTRHLEVFYKNGSDTSTVVGRYPSTDMTASTTTIKAALRDIDLASVTAPGAVISTDTLTAATNTLETVYTVTPIPTVDQYIYQPFAWDGTNWVLCTGSMECRRYNVYYRLESDNMIYKVSGKNT